MKQPRTAMLLLVEDDEKLCLSMERFLSRRGYQVAIALTAAGALERLERLQPQAAIVDLHLPDDTGLHVLEMMRARGHAIPVILVTADDAPGTRELAEACGVFAFLTKPVQPLELLRQLERALCCAV